MRVISAIMYLFVSLTGHAACPNKPIVIAVIDTGFGYGWAGEETAHLCKFGHKNFVDDINSDKFKTMDPVPVDVHSHGTHIAGTIDQYAKGSFCMVILKYYDPKANDLLNLKRTIKAIDYARQIHADIINYSGGGILSDKQEIDAVKKFLDEGGIFVAAAGNEHADLVEKPYYPAQDDDRVIVVGNGTSEEYHAGTSNHGKRVNRWEQGENVRAYNYYMTGTSQATAIATGKIVAEKRFCK